MAPVPWEHLFQLADQCQIRFQQSVHVSGVAIFTGPVDKECYHNVLAFFCFSVCIVGPGMVFSGNCDR